MMNIKGFQKLTLLDYREYLTATIFLGGCNFRCPFCHNKDLVLHPNALPDMDCNTILETLKKRSGMLEAVCITGGEPTLCPDLLTFLNKIKSLGYRIKLDTNGYRPDVLKELLQEQVLDYVAMDIKNSPDKYALTTGLDQIDLDKINESIEIIKQSGGDYEFRTTIIKELHSSDDILHISQWIAGAKSYTLQSYRETEEVIHPIYSAHTKETLESFVSIAKKYIQNVQLIGL